MLTLKALRSLAIVILVVGCSACFADCLGNDPIVAARSLLEKHHDFYADPETSRSFVSPRFWSLLDKQAKCSVKSGGVCALDWDPWTGAQDGEMSAKKTFEVADGKPLSAVALIKFELVLNGYSYGAKEVKLELIRKEERACWQVADLVMPDGKSLSTVLSKFFSTYDLNGNKKGSHTAS